MPVKREVFKTDRSDRRFLSTMGFCHSLYRTLKPKLAFDPSFSREELVQWQQAVRRKLAELMAFPDVSEQPAPRQLWAEPRDGYELQKWEIYPEPGCVMPILVLVPEQISAHAPGPAVLCFSGSQGSKELLAGEPEIGPRRKKSLHPEHSRMAVWYARAGMVAVAVENPATGEQADDAFAAVFDHPDANPDKAPRGGLAVDRARSKLSLDLVYMGRNYIGLSVFQRLRLLDWVRTLDFVDAKRVAVSGMSLGTEPAMVMGVLDPALSAVVYNDFVCNFQQRFVVSCLPEQTVWHSHTPVWHLVPGFLQWFDYTDLLAAMAPQPLLVCEGGVAYYVNLVRKAYKILGAEDNLHVGYYSKYANPADREHDLDDIPEGLTNDEYYEYAYIDVANHYFKAETAVPWLSGVFSRQA